MNSKRLSRLKRGTIIALALYLLMAIYMLIAIPLGQPKWSSLGLAEIEIQRADLQTLQTDLRSAVTSLATFRHDKNQLMLILFFAAVAMIAFLAWSLFMMCRLKKED